MTVELEKKFYSLSNYLEFPKSNFEVYKKTGIVFDSEGLVEVDERFSLKKDSILFDNKFVLYYSPFLRRYYTSNFIETTDLIAFLSQFKKIKISLDYFRILEQNHHNFEIGEKDHWWGEKFNQEKLNDGKYEGIVVYGRKKQDFCDEYNHFSPWSIIRTEFRIKNKENGIKQIEIEEIVSRKQIEKILPNNHVHKYLHLLWDAKNKKISHLDFAIQIYSLDEYEKRKNNNWKMNKEKTSIRRKIFRIDDSLDYTQGLELISHFFRYNEMIHQFFSGK